MICVLIFGAVATQPVPLTMEPLNYARIFGDFEGDKDLVYIATDTFDDITNLQYYGLKTGKYFTIHIYSLTNCVTSHIFSHKLLLLN